MKHGGGSFMLLGYFFLTRSWALIKMENIIDGLKFSQFYFVSKHAGVCWTAEDDKKNLNTRIHTVHSKFLSVNSERVLFITFYAFYFSLCSVGLRP